MSGSGGGRGGEAEATSGASRERRRRPAGGRAGRWKWKQHHKAERDERRGLFFSQVGHVGVCVGRARERATTRVWSAGARGGGGRLQISRLVSKKDDRQEKGHLSMQQLGMNCAWHRKNSWQSRKFKKMNLRQEAQTKQFRGHAVQHAFFTPRSSGVCFVYKL